MATNDWSGLFKGPASATDAQRRQQQLERDARIRMAGEGMDPLVAAAARSTQGMKEAIGGIGKGLTGLMGVETRMDPRMAQAVKRDKDRQEILTMLEGFNDPKSAGGADISDKELNLGYSALLKKGYVQEAKEFLAMAQSMRTEVREDKKADAALTRARAALRKAMKEGKMKPAEMSQIEDSIKRALGEEVILTKDASGAVTSVRVNGKDLDNTQIAALNTHIKNALDAYINAGEGAKGYQAVENYVIAKINPTLPGPSQSPSSSGGSTPPPPPGFVPPPPANP
tara:strand:- start:1788 stop:2639 length:852 start_codon:yes stop_codon:yes gene_type:complete